MPTATATSTAAPDPLDVLRHHPPTARRRIIDAVSDAAAASGTKLWSPVEIAATGRISQHALYRAVASKRLPATRLGKNRIIITDAALQTFLTARDASRGV